MSGTGGPACYLGTGGPNVAASGAVGAVEALYRSLPETTDPPISRDVLRGRMTLSSLLRRSGSSATVTQDVQRIGSYEEFVAVAAELGRSVSTELLGLVPDSPRAAEGLRASRDVDLALLAKGVSTYLVYEPGWAQEPLVARGVRALLDAGALARVIDRVPHRLMIFDRSVALMPIIPTDVRAGGLAVHELSLVRSLTTLFDGIWKRAVDYAEFDPEATRGVDPRERLVLELMSTGVTDESAARSLDVSVRTYRRWVADLMTRLGAQSRFQAGVIAVERGWL